MNKLQSTAYLLIIVFTLLNVGSAAALYCFDGGEIPVSLHFESIGGHVEHNADQNHIDSEKDIVSENITSKILDINFLFFLVATVFSLLAVSISGPTFKKLPIQSRELYSLSPPLRAPPLYS